jgi:hypothetical protein
MNHRLSDRVSWGDRYSPGELKADVGAVVALCENAELVGDPGASPFAQLLPNHPKPYLWLPVNDHHEPTAHFWRYLDFFLATVKHAKQRLLVNCWAGHHRSPAIAIYAEMLLTDWAGGTDRRLQLLDQQKAIEPNLHVLTFSTAVHRRIDSVPFLPPDEAKQ